MAEFAETHYREGSHCERANRSEDKVVVQEQRHAKAVKPIKREKGVFVSGCLCKMKV